MGVRDRFVEWGYERFYETPFLFDTRVGPAVASLGRDAVFLASLAWRGDVGETIVRTGAGDHELYVDLRDAGVSRTLYVTGEYEPTLTRAAPRLVDEGDVVVDVGANLGYFTVLFSRAVGPAGTVHAFEPDPRTFDLLARNVALNDCGNVVAERVAAADAAGTVELARDGDQFSRTTLRNGRDPSAGAFEAPAVTVDGHVDGPVDLLKVDVAGAEPVAVEGALDTLATHRPRLAVPYLPGKWGDDGRRMLDRLRSLGYDAETMDGRPLDYDGALAAGERVPNVLFEP